MASSRPRNGGSSAVVRFEDFHPTSERHVEEGAEILTIYLPGFEKEHIKITYVHSTRIIRVQGERSIGNNIWSRFNEPFPVPQNCEANKIGGKLQSGVLTITMPKQIMTPLIISTKVDVKPSEPPKQPKPSEPPKTGVDPIQPSKGQQETKPSEPPKTGLDPIRPSKDQKETKPSEPPKTGLDPLRPSKDQQEPKPSEPPKTGLDSHRPSKDQEPKPIEPPLPPKPAAPQPKVKPATAVPLQTPGEGVRKQEIEETPKVAPSTTTKMAKDDDKVMPSDQRQIVATVDKESSKKMKELVISDAALEKEERRKEEKVKEDKDTLLEKLKEKKKKSVEVLGFDITEDRQALLNAGVALLVIVAVGAYITYRNIKSSGNTEN